MKTPSKAFVAVPALALLPLAVGAVSPGSHTTPGASAATKQSGRTILMPQIVHRGPKVAPSRMARLTGRVKFDPARPGRPVVIQRKVGNNPCSKVAVKRQNKHGAVAFKGRARTRGRLDPLPRRGRTLERTEPSGRTSTTRGRVAHGLPGRVPGHGTEPEQVGLPAPGRPQGRVRPCLLGEHEEGGEGAQRPCRPAGQDEPPTPTPPG
jgi:hypothetical protein